MQLRQSLRLDGRKVCNIKRADISQAGRNKATACVVPSSHLPLTREASVVVRSEVLLPFAMVVGMERVDATGGASPLPYEKRVG